MLHLFAPDGEQAIARLMRRRPLLAFDFDGTIAPIVAWPDDAQAPPEISRLLETLGQHLPVAVITGRNIADVRPRLGFEPRYVVGNHGAEGLDDGPPNDAMPQLQHLLQRHADAFSVAGIQVENKGLSVALHFRLAKDVIYANAVLQAFVAELPSDFTTFGGKFVLNVVARFAPNKGDAVKSLLAHSGCDSVLFVGDDVNDEAVFECAGADWLTVRIESAPGASRAMFFVDSPAQLVTLLEKMQALLPSHSAPRLSPR